jgi:hypothetical protein
MAHTEQCTLAADSDLLWPDYPCDCQCHGDGNPDFPGGLGCEWCDSLWATSDSLDAHEREAHMDELIADAYIPGSGK